jgi:NAD(P)-dependent dehydrogenase (short-subunit alcohol dehydrogenase family)
MTTKFGPSKTGEKKFPQQQPPQHQDQKPGIQADMTPQPVIDDPAYKPSGKLKDNVAVITGGDSGIGAAVAVLFAKEGADVAIVYLNEHEDAQHVKGIVEGYGRQCQLIPADITQRSAGDFILSQVLETFGKVDILINNAGEHWEQDSLLELDLDLMEKTFQTNVFSMFYLTKAILPHLKEGSTIINTTSVTAFKGSGHLLDYSSTKGAVETFTYSLAQQLADKGIRVNGVAPGPIWTPLIVASFDPQDVAEFGKDVLMKRAGQPCEVANCFLFLASSDSSYMTGQILHPNGGTVIH